MATVSTTPRLNDCDLFLEAALEYARRGWAVFPLQPREKTPLGRLAPHGFKNATTDEDQIREWWGQAPDSNIGIACGASKLLVVDVDPRNGGKDELDDLFVGAGKDGFETLTSKTGGGGWHYLFEEPPWAVTVKELAPGIDIKAAGGYIVAPPSLHPTGRPYEWEDTTAEVTAMPGWLAQLVERKCKEKSQSNHRSSAVPEAILEGHRDSMLYSLACSLRHKGLEYEEILAALQKANQRRCKPPLPGEQVAKIATQGCKHPAGEVPQLLIAAPSNDVLLSETTGMVPTSHESELAIDVQPALSSFNRTDAGNAERLFSRFGHQVRHCEAQKSWYIWTPERWLLDQTNAIMSLPRAMSQELYFEARQIEDEKLREVSTKWALASESGSRMEQGLKWLRGQPGISVIPDQFDRDPWLLNCVNGTLDLRTGELRRHNPADLITKLCPVEYDPGARSETWKRFLQESTGGNEGLMNYLQRAVGYSLTGLTSAEVFFVICGPAASGKTTFAEAILATIGDYGTATNAMAFTANNYENAHSSFIASLVGKRFVVASEFSDDQTLDAARMKELTGGQTITAKQVYGKPFSYRPQFKPWFTTNDAPGVSYGDDGIWRRLRTIPFDQAVEKPDPGIKAELVDSERSGSAILAWAVRGCLDWRKEGLASPTLVSQRTNQHRESQNTVRDFINGKCRVGEDFWVERSVLHRCFCSWCIRWGQKPPGRNSFYSAVRTSGFKESKRQGIDGFRGLGVEVDA